MNKQEMQAKAREGQAKAKDGVSRMASALPPELRQRVSNTNTWLRFVFVFVLFTVIYFFLFRLLLWVTGLLILTQFLFMLFTGGTNTVLNNLNRRLATYVGQIWEYLLFCSDRFPLPDWLRNLSSSSSSADQPTPPSTDPATDVRSDDTRAESSDSRQDRNT